MRYLAVLFVAGLLGACASPPPLVTAADAERAHVELAQLQTGRTLVIKKCGGCHKAPRPLDKPAAAWPQSIDEMAQRAHLEVDEKRAIEAYLVAMSR